MKKNQKRQFNIKNIVIHTSFGDFLCRFESNFPEKGYTVTSSQAEGFVTFGPNLKEAKKMAKEGLEFHCESIAFERIENQFVENFKNKPVAVLSR